MNTNTVKPGVRVLVTGSRTWPDADALTGSLDALLARFGRRLVIVHGACGTGVDALADRWAHARGVQVERYPANWHRYGRRAGLIRNQQMVATAPDMCVAFIYRNSPGATHCARAAQAAGIRTLCLRRGGAV